MILAVAICAAVFVTAPAAQAAPRDVSSDKLRKTVTLEGLTEHLEAFQAIGDANGDTRATGTPGYEESVEYVMGTLEKLGYEVTTPEFNYPVWEENTPATLTWGTQTFTSSPSSASGTAVDMITFGFAQSGTLTDLLVVPTNDIVIHSGASNTSTSGCEMSDFPATVEGNIALIQRGTCPFVQKLANAEDAGAAGVILFNEGNDPTRVNPQFIEGPFDLGIPAVYVSSTIGTELYAATQAGPVRVTLATDTTTTPRFFRNVVAYSPTGDPDNTVMLGAHLDSVPAGPGVNDNGSGSSALLEIAEGIAKLAKNKNKGSLTNRVAFAFWGAEESGLIGSTYFVENLSAADKADIMANLNFDMLASPNFARLVYDGDGSSFGTEGPAGSDIIEHVFNQYFESQGLAYEGTAFTGRSDYGPFIAEDIPAGGLFTGAEERKTAEQAARYGGVAGAWLDPCYHQACDTLSTLLGSPPLDAQGFVPLPADERPAAAAALAGNGMVGFDQMADAAAHATWYLTMASDPLAEEPTLTLPKRAGKRR
jgi:Zn-dependent M28 family amino/carboxypeptidase